MENGEGMNLTEMDGGEFQWVPLGSSSRIVGGHARENVSQHLRLSSESRYATGGDHSRTQSSHSTRPFGGQSHPTNSDQFRVIPSNSDRRGNASVMAGRAGSPLPAARSQCDVDTTANAGRRAGDCPPYLSRPTHEWRIPLANPAKSSQVPLHEHVTHKTGFCQSSSIKA